MKIIITEAQYNRILEDGQGIESEENEQPSAEDIQKADGLISSADAIDTNKSDEAADMPAENVFQIDSTFSVAKNNTYALNKAIESIKKMANKLKMPQPIITMGKEHVKVFSANERRYAVDVIDVRIQAENMFTLGTDYELLAIVDNGNGGSVLIGDNQVPTDGLKPSQVCDLCNLNRHRGKSYVVVDKTSGEFKRFGGDCIQKIFGINPSKYLAAIAFITSVKEVCEGMDEGDGPRGGGGRGFSNGTIIIDMDKTITIIKDVLDKVGYVKKEHEVKNDYYGRARKERTNYGSATADIVDPILLDDDRMEALVPDMNLVSSFKEYWANYQLKPDDVSGFGEFMANIKTLVGSGQIRIKDIGAMVYALHNFTQHLQTKDKPESNYIGAVGDKVSLENVTLLSMRTFESQYGEGKIWMMEDSLGNQLKKFGELSAKFRIKESGGEDVGGFGKGDVFSFIAEIKKHEEFNGKKSTLLGRLGALAKPKAVKAIKEALNEYKFRNNYL